MGRGHTQRGEGKGEGRTERRRKLAGRREARRGRYAENLSGEKLGNDLSVDQMK